MQKTAILAVGVGKCTLITDSVPYVRCLAREQPWAQDGTANEEVSVKLGERKGHRSRAKIIFRRMYSHFRYSQILHIFNNF